MEQEGHGRSPPLRGTCNPPSAGEEVDSALLHGMQGEGGEARGEEYWCRLWWCFSLVLVCRLEEVVMTSLRTREGMTPDVSASSVVCL